MSDSYYGRPIVKPHVWKPFIPWYFWIGGMAGAASVQCAIARLAGRDELATVQKRAALAGAMFAPVLLIADLGVPHRFANMFRVFKLTSPMSVGSWALGAFGGAITASTLAELFGWKRTSRVLETGSATLGPFIAVYTAVLVADTATPVWHDAYETLPFVFAANAVASAGAVGCAFTTSGEAGLARRLMTGGSIASLAAMRTMRKRLGPMLAEPYERGKAGSFTRAAEWLLLAGGALALVGGRNSAIARAAAACVISGGILDRFAISAAGKQSAEDPKYVVESQRARVAARGGAEPRLPSPPDRSPSGASGSGRDEFRHS